MGANNGDFQAYVGKEGGSIRVGDLFGTNKVRFIDLENNPGDSLDSKLKSAKNPDRKEVGRFGTSLYDSIKKHGVVTPVSIAFTGTDSAQVTGGHHRIAAANDIDPDMQIPWKKGIEGIPEIRRTSSCPTCKGDGLDKKDLDRHYARSERTQEEFDINDVKSCPSCNGEGVV